MEKKKVKKVKKDKGRTDEELFGNTDDIFASVPDNIPKKTTTKKKKKKTATSTAAAAAAAGGGGGAEAGDTPTGERMPIMCYSVEPIDVDSLKSACR